ncbi:MAG: tetratricopeptide repeat protein [Terriglobia bacterium]
MRRKLTLGFVTVVFSLACVAHSPNRESQRQANDEVSRGENSFRNAQYVQAIDHFKKATALDPALFQARLDLLATAYFRISTSDKDSPDFKEIGDQAIAAFQDVLKNDPQNPIALSNIAMIDYVEQNFQKAKEIWEDLRKVEPNNPQAYYWIGVSDWSMVYPKIQKARAGLGLTTPRDWTKPGILPSLPDSARAQLRAENGALIDDGIKALEKASELMPHYKDAMAYLNLLYRLKADTEENKTDSGADIKNADELVDQIRAQQSR